MKILSDTRLIMELLALAVDEGMCTIQFLRGRCQTSGYFLIGASHLTMNFTMMLMAQPLDVEWLGVIFVVSF